MPKSAIRLLAVVLAVLAGLYSGAAGAVELKVLSTEAMRATLQELAPAFEAASKHKLVIAYAADADVEKKVASDETIDIAILTKPVAAKALIDFLAGPAAKKVYQAKGLQTS